MRLAAVFLMALCSCTMLEPSHDRFPVMQTQVAGHVLSCKGTRCCWPWGEKEFVCAEPLEGDGLLTPGGAIITLHGQLP